MLQYITDSHYHAAFPLKNMQGIKQQNSILFKIAKNCVFDKVGNKLAVLNNSINNQLDATVTIY